MHDYDHLLPDYSREGVADTVALMQGLLQEVDDLPTEALNATQEIDKKLCAGFLRIQCWEFDSGRFHRGNPAMYCGEAIFGVMSLFLSEFAPLADRVAVATSRLSAIPELLGQGQQNIHEAPAPWIRQAIEECDGALLFLGNDAALAAGDALTEAYQSAVRDAAHAFHEFQSWLAEELMQKATVPVGCGEQALSLHLTEGHCLKDEADDIAAYAQSEMQKAADRLTAFEKDDPQLVGQSLDELHPSVDEYYKRYQQVWDDIQQLAVNHDLLSWPEFPIEYVAQPTWARRAAEHLYFLYYRSPAAFNRPPVHKYLVTPIERDMPAEQQDALLRSNNDSAIKLNHVVHHGGIGHHVQNWHAFRSASQTGRMAAVDCASRIAMNCGGTMAEGWACYATDLISEFGGLTEREAVAEWQTRKRMCARAIVDIRFHQGRFSFADSVDFYTEHAGMPRDAAANEATRNSMYPGSAVMYLTGCDAIHNLRNQLATKLGSDFSLRDFHDTFLSFGSIPVALIADEMLRAQNQGN